MAAPDGRKLVGLAQRRQRDGVLLVAGTLIADPDWSLLCGVMGHPEDEATLRRRSVSCQALAGGPMAVPSCLHTLLVVPAGSPPPGRVPRR